MDNRYNVSIKMVSEWEEQSTVQLADGILYNKSGIWFLRYEEPDRDQGIITATIRIAPDQIKLMRRGAVESDMAFEMGITHRGYYSTPLVQLELETITTGMLVELVEGEGRLMWSYLLSTQAGSATQADFSSPRQVTVWLSR